MEASTAAEEDFVLADATFHRRVVRATGNEVLTACEGVVFSALWSSSP